ncbi:MAG TPA: ParB N-terminal domain-containing protein [Mycobacterium sp.]|uniref:ParB N-terminal domain-containing protein n=1 Tax=Mycobacterium sp. TaxID=1785 RepID=UPI002D46E577|nr:ParB N-terminal domain-containing protein [Mycobacterium sp.]HZU48539.1 ParB N-terminal domain-containing protein [Mycobacterium sp.]
MHVETVPIEKISTDSTNARRHPTRNTEAIKASLQRFGQQKPIVVDAQNVCRAGNGTLAAAKALGWTEVRVVRTSLAPKEATAYAIADNRSAELAEWDQKVLSELLQDPALGDLNQIGFTQRELTELSAPVQLLPSELAPAPVMTWVLIGIPTIRFGQISERVEEIAAVPDAVVEITANGPDQDR